MLVGKTIPIVLAACLLLDGASSGLAADSLPVEPEPPYGEEVVAPRYGTEVWSPPPLPLVPGPGWLADDPNRFNGPIDVPPGADEWRTPYPFKYFPQGHIPSDTPDFPSCLLSPESADACFCTTPPTYFGTLFFEGIVLNRRSGFESIPLIRDGINNTVFNTADLTLNMEAGIRGGVLLSSPCGNDWIGEYFGIHNFAETATIADPAGLTDEFFGAGGAATSFTVEYVSSLDSVELMVRTRQSRRIAPLAGIRYLSVHEEFNILTDPAARVGRFSRTENDLFGFQFGMQGLVCEHGPLRIETTLKAGPYFNDVDVSVQQIPTGQVDVVNRYVSHTHTAFVGEWRVGLVCRLGRRVNFLMSYQGLWIEGIGLGPNQSNNISYTTNLESVDLSGVTLQGGSIGFDLSW